uniref:hypothetical protein n=1 Tax=Xenorhabdus griffiniae TaxID=351672 RepID=UPI001CB9BC91
YQIPVLRTVKKLSAEWQHGQGNSAVSLSLVKLRAKWNPALSVYPIAFWPVLLKTAFVLQKYPQ